MRTPVFFLAPVILLAFAIAACGSDSEPAAQAEEPFAPVPRTVDKGDGCTVEITKNGTGAVARVGDEVALTYEARVKDAETTFSSTDGWNTPLRVRVGEAGILPGLSRGIDGLRSGTKARIEIPPALGYGDDGNPSAHVPPNATLIFDVEIVGVRP